MSLLSQIQTELLDDKANIGPILLKLRFLASRLDVPILEDWVKHEIDGYPAAVDLPDYRITPVTYTGTFQSSFQILREVPIPSFLIEKFASQEWNTHDIRSSMVVIESMIAKQADGSSYQTNAADLILMLQGNIYNNSTCISITGHIQPSAFINVQSSVRSKALDLTLGIEKAAPSATAIVLGQRQTIVAPDESERMGQAVQFVINGTFNQVNNSGTSGQITVQSTQGNSHTLLEKLTKAGWSDGEARELTEVVKSETPNQDNGSIGSRALAWLRDKSDKITTAGLVEVTRSAIKDFYGVG